MATELPEMDFQRFWRRLQQLGLNAYEARSYLVLIGHPRFKALELAARAHVPRQKIYEVLDSLVEKGFAQVVQEKTKLFSAVEPSLAIPGYLGRKRRMLSEVSREYLEFSRPPYAVDPLEERLVKQAGSNGVACRLLLEAASLDDEHRQRLTEYMASGVEVRLADSLPMKLALFDGQR